MEAHIISNSNNRYEEDDIQSDNDDPFELFDFEDYNIFSLARHCKYIELEALLIKGINPDSKDENGNTILIIGAQNGNKRIVKISLRYGAQINMFNNMGNTALHFTNEYQFFSLSEYLIKKGSNPSAKNLRGFKASEGIRKHDGKKLVKNVNQNNYKLSNKAAINNKNNKNNKKDSPSKDDDNKGVYFRSIDKNKKVLKKPEII